MFQNWILAPLSLAFVEIAFWFSFQPRSLLLLLTLQAYMDLVFCIRSFQAFPTLTIWFQILSFSSFKSSPSILWSSFGSYTCSVPICNLLYYIYIFQSFKMFPIFYFLCFYTFILPFYQLFQFFIISYSPSFLKHNWSKYIPWYL